MFVLKVLDKDGTEQELSFETVKLATLYRDYHLAFGNWNNRSRWIEASSITPEESRFICDEMCEIRNGEIVRLYRVTDGLRIILEEARSNETVSQAWKRLRQNRAQALQDTDWTQMADVQLSQDLRKQYRGYRQYLRDLPKLHSDGTVPMAEVYSFEMWLEGKR